MASTELKTEQLHSSGNQKMRILIFQGSEYVSMGLPGNKVFVGHQLKIYS